MKAASEDAVREAAARHVDPERIAAQVDAAMDDPLYWFGVRHHSPATARFLRAAMQRRRPKLVLIEGPSEASELIPFVVDEKTKPPVAIYSSYRDDDDVLGLAGIESSGPDVPARFATWYPLTAYSPEYVAMACAKRLGAEVVFVDLPHHALIRPAKPVGEDEPARETDDDAPGDEQSDRKHVAEPDAERLMAESDFYRSLAEVAGFKSWDEAWDSLFESFDLARDPDEFRREMASFCAAARATTPRARMEHDGTLERERFMWRAITDAIAARKLRFEDAFVVTGGFHLFLDRDDPTPPPTPPAGTVYATVAPYSFFRISELSGYGAGNRAPQYYQGRWENDDPEAGLVEHVVAVLARARRKGEPLSSADAIAVSQHAGMLARLRGRRQPVLDDLHDALVTCCCKGDPEQEGVHLLAAIDEADIGTKVGRVTPRLGRLPVLNDFYARVDELDLGEMVGREKKVSLALDKREPRDAARSVFLHRLRHLGVPIGALTDAPATGVATGTLFRERWALRWSPKIEASLIELNLYGDTVEAAALARLKAELAADETHAGDTCGRLLAAVDMDFPDLVAHAEEACGRAIDADGRFVSLAGALGHLLVLDRYAVFRSVRREVLADLVERCFGRACFAIPDAASVPEEEQPGVVDGLRALAEALLTGQGEAFDRALFTDQVRIAADGSTVPFLRGALLGMLAELRALTPEELALELGAYASAPTDRMVRAGEFLQGVLAVSRTSIMLGADALVGALDQVLAGAPWEVFLVMLPRLRAAFEQLHDRQTDAIAERVAVRYGLAEAESLTELGTASVEAAALFARIDREVARIMEGWSF